MSARPVEEPGSAPPDDGQLAASGKNGSLEQLAGLWPRFGALAYDGVLLFGLTFLASWVFVVLLGDATHGLWRLAHQGYLLAVAGAYLIFCWLRSGQTLAMKTWGLRLVTLSGDRLTPGRAVMRYGLATVGLLLLAAGFVWALVDRERQFLHDRLLGTRIVRAPI